jgi:hypothetical protein
VADTAKKITRIPIAIAIPALSILAIIDLKFCA